ncbi:MAG: pyridoxal-phosphate dependent enzyme [bacterium]
MAKYEKVSYKDLYSDSSQPALPLNWRKPSGEISRVILPKQMTGTAANIIVMCPDCFPTASSYDGSAYFNLRYMMENKKIKGNVIEVCAMDSAIVSYAWAASILGVKCVIRVPQMTYPYWIKKATEFGAKIEFEGVKTLDVTRIIDSNKKKENFISEFQSPISYSYHAHVTGRAISKAVEGIGNSKMVVLAYPASSGGLTGAASIAKRNYPYSKTIVVEPEACSTFYNNKKGVHKLYGMGYGLIPYIHNVMATDYVMPIDEEEAIKTLKCIEDFGTKIASEFKIETKAIKPLVQKLGISTVACIMSGINLAQQLHLSADDNIVIIGEDTAIPYKEVLKAELLEDIDVKPTIEEAFIKHKFRPVVDVTGQRQRERLFKKKNDFWIRRGIDDSVLENMRKKEFWDKFPTL